MLIDQLRSILPSLIAVRHWNAAAQAWQIIWPWLDIFRLPPVLVDGDYYLVFVTQSCTLSYSAPDGRHYEFELTKISPMPNNVTWLPLPPEAAPPFAYIAYQEHSSRAAPGIPGSASITIRNTGGVAALMSCAVEYSDNGQVQVYDALWVNILPNEAHSWVISFPMPDHAIEIYIKSGHADPTTHLPVTDETLGPYPIELDPRYAPAPTPPGVPPQPTPAPPTPSGLARVTKPSTLQNALDSAWLNFEAGGWFTILGVRVPPWSFTPGLWIESAVDFLLGPVNAIITAVLDVSVHLTEAWNKAYEALGKIDNILSSLTHTISSYVTSWWSSAFQTVKVAISTAAGAVSDFAKQVARDVVGLGTKLQSLTDVTRGWQTWLLKSLATIPPIDTLIAGFNKAESFFALYLTPIGDFLTSPVDWIFDRIDNWLNEEV
ncbi:MAG: Mtc1 family protein [Dehalococcoidia bacterium]|nr:Mtc1 family protein [Dehalococcoidia bacterium]